ncbi:MAG: YerC/YecD family TrpR-related protein [Patescibacteria group bacterium]|nr:YerC/YecD family TrpR-related protein [Patescibacteria group bacterium]
MSNKLYQAILSLKTKKEVQIFLRDLLTLREIKTITQRFKIARLLHQGLPYAKIAKLTNTSTTTVTRVSHWLKHGKGGYKLALKRLHEGS